MGLSLLKHIEGDFLDYIDGLPSQALGKKAVFYSGREPLLYDKFKIAVLGVPDNRGGEGIEVVGDLKRIRKAFYALYPGNWSTKLVDLGDVQPGATINDTYYLVSEVVRDLVSKGVIPIVLGGTQDITYSVYRAYEGIAPSVNLVSIDAKLDVNKEGAALSESFLSRIILEEPTHLFNFANLGYQTYYNAQEEIDLIEGLYFEAVRLGELINNIKRAEPILRDADIVSLDMQTVKSSDSGNFEHFNPNGFDGREICSLARYAGLSDRVSNFGIYNHNNSAVEALLIAQIMWYFIEGVNFRTNEYPFTNKEECIKYIVPIEGYDDFIFYKSKRSERWWMEVPIVLNDEGARVVYLPCSYEDYMLATRQEIPLCWWRMIKKSLV